MARYPGAVWYGTAKFGYGTTLLSGWGATVHSMDGWFSNIHAMLDDPARRGSWHFSIRLDGYVEQHVDSILPSWHCGDYDGNIGTWGIELEGRHSYLLVGTTPDPVPDKQLTALADLLRWLWATHNTQGGFTLGTTLQEHRQWGTSACPNERFTGARMWNRLLALLGGDDAMTPEEKARLENAEANIGFLLDMCVRNGVWKDGIVNSEKIFGQEAYVFVREAMAARNVSFYIHDQELYADKHKHDGAAPTGVTVQQVKALINGSKIAAPP